MLDLLKDSSQLNSTLVKIILESIKEGDLGVIKSHITSNNLNIKNLIDTQTGQNGYFFATLIKRDVYF